VRNLCGPTVRGEFLNVKMQILEDGLIQHNQDRGKDRHPRSRALLAIATKFLPDFLRNRRSPLGQPVVLIVKASNLH